MCVRYFGFVLLIWFPAELHAQSATESCSAPRLDGGFFAPKELTYSHGSVLTYTCNDGRKPAVKGWWAKVTCDNGKWSHQPQCIDEKACIPPTVPNGNYTENTNGWYEEGDTIRISCDAGYKHKDRVTTDRCVNGAWPSLPTCEKSDDTCSEPPKIAHAVIINQGYQEEFAADSEVQYECEGGYTMEGTDTKKTVFCKAGTWTEGPTCRSSATSDNRPVLMPVSHCGTNPLLPNGDVVLVDRMHLKYKCNSFYTQVGSDTVTCYSDGTWSQLPVCREAFCVMKPARYHDGFELKVNEYIKEGEKKYLPCTWRDYSMAAQCTNGRIHYTNCCSSSDHYWNYCGVIGPLPSAE